MVCHEADSRKAAGSRYREQSARIVDALLWRWFAEAEHPHARWPRRVRRSSFGWRAGHSRRYGSGLWPGDARLVRQNVSGCCRSGNWLHRNRRGDCRSRQCGECSRLGRAASESSRIRDCRKQVTEHPDFTYWQESEQAQQFRRVFKPAVIQMDYRLPDLENATRNYGVTLGEVASRTTQARELQKASLVMRAQSYRRRLFAEFEKVQETLLP